MNPSYKQYFVYDTDIFPNLVPMTSTLSSVGYSPQNVPLAPLVTNLADQQARKYQDQLALFRKVYAYNSTVYTNSLQGATPIYYTFQTYAQLNGFKEAKQLVNKLYPFDRMTLSQNQNGSTLGWIVPFPL